MNEIVEVKFKSSFQRPGIYKIVVEGDLSKRISYLLSGMQISVAKSTDKISFTTLIGQISDQSALLGILNTLYDNHHTILSVNILEENAA
jgi:hypothetical protein